MPEEHREAFQAKLAKLRDAAPRVRFADMRRVMEDDLDGPLRAHFAEFDEAPIAAASIGQVYRARLRDGREVAVKVQYPGVAQAVRADLQNLGMILRILRTIAPGLDVRSTAAEVRERVTEELDYELEAQNQRTLARLYRGHPFIRVPEVLTELSRERVLVTEFVRGTGFEALRERDQACRDRVGEIVFRFYFGCMYRHGRFSGDPHPGNFLLEDGGTVAFLDFGLFKTMPRELLEVELAVARAGHEGDAERVHRLLAEGGVLPDPERFSPGDVLDQLMATSRWYLRDAPVRLRPETATRVILELSDPRSRHFDSTRRETLPADHIFGRRVELLTLAVLAQLRVHGNFHRIAREWMYGAPPVTELGRREAAFWARA